MSTLTVIIVISEILSLLILFRIWRGNGSTTLKTILSIVAVIPVVGPIFYFVAEPHPIQRRSFQDKPSRISHLGGYGRYSEWWDEQRPRMQKRIKELEAENQEQEQEKNQNERNQ